MIYEVNISFQAFVNERLYMYQVEQYLVNNTQENNELLRVLEIHIPQMAQKQNNIVGRSE